MKSIIIFAGLTLSIAGFGQTAQPFKEIKAERKDCNIAIQWAKEGELNIAKYEIETGTDGSNFYTIATIEAKNEGDYVYSLPINEQTVTPVMFIRIKATEQNGNAFYYSKIVITEGICNADAQLPLYVNSSTGPNSSSITVATKKISLTGHYFTKIIDENGKLVQSDDIQLKNAKSFMLFFGSLKPGKYMISVTKDDRKESGLVSFVKQ